MKTIFKYVTLVVFFCSSCFFVQSQDKCLSFIIVIDDEIAIGSIFDVRINAVTGEDSFVIKTSYYPGNLQVDFDSKPEITQDDVTNLFLIFSWNNYEGGKHRILNYEVEIKKEWLNEKFCILRVYNLYKKRYKNAFYLNDVSKGFLFELDSPSYGFKLVRRK